MSFWEKLKGVFLSPTEMFNSVKDEGVGGSLIYFVKCLPVYAILGIIASLIPPEWFGALVPPEWAGFFGVFFLTSALLGLWAIHPVVFIAYNLVPMIICILVGSLWMHILVYLSGGRRGVGQTTKAIAYGSTPLLLLGWIPFLGRIVFGIWTLVVQVIGIRQLHEISTGRAVLAYIIGIISPAIVIAVFLIILLRALGGPYIPPS